jgi:DNA-binding Lrp family transcriptional regulator
MTHIKTELSSTDLTILIKLQQDARLSSADLASGLNISTMPTWRRIKRLEEQGFIKG